VTWLLVEDDPDIRNVVAVMMQLWGEKPLTLSDGNAAWTWLDGVVSGNFKGELPDLALMDIRMPGHTGDQIAARIRGTDRLKDIPIILMTAFSLTEAEVQNMVEHAGIDHLVKKPLPDMDDFRSTLYRVRDERSKRIATMPKATPISPVSAATKPVSAASVATLPTSPKSAVVAPASAAPTSPTKATKPPAANVKPNTPSEPPKSPTSTVSTAKSKPTEQPPIPKLPKPKS